MASLTPERWQQVEQVLDRALDLAPQARAAFVAETCSGDPKLRAEVERLLVASESADSLLGGPAADFASPILARVALEEALVAGERVGGYQIVRELGRGGMAKVYLAHDAKHGRDVALKILHPEFRETVGADRFLREIRLIARLQHPHILPLIDSGNAGGHLFYVMPYVEGESLRARLGRGELPLADAVAILREVADALAYAHSRGVIHRDIKPDNVLLTGRHAVVTDFGIAKAASTASDAQGTTMGIAVGTPAYMAPEQVLADPALDHRADIYALGVLGYELLVGQPPFSGRSAQAVLAAHVMETPEPVERYRPTVPPALASVIGSCLAKPPADRPQSAEEVLRALEAIAIPGVGRPPASGEPRVLLPPAPGNLPVPLTSFVGRDHALAEVTRLLSGARLLTLMGPAGSGKTRLALAAAAAVADRYEHGVWWADLSAVSDPAPIPQVLASALGLREVPGRSLADTLSQYLSAGTRLLVLDNCEHLVESIAQLAGTLLRAAPHLRILATSREALSYPGETVWLVPPLTYPDRGPAAPLETLAGYGSVRLFCDRAAAVLPSFELTGRNADAVARVCRDLEGIPLAIELAAARVKVLSPEQIAERLGRSPALLAASSRAVPERHRTLQAAIEWSHDLLPDEERILFRRMSVFAGGCDLEALEAVAPGGGLEPDAILDLLTRLVEKSLVMVEERQGRARYRLLETIRRFGAEKLADANEAEAVGRRHASWFLARAESGAPVTGPPQLHWIAAMTQERDNVRAAIDRLLKWAEVETVAAFGWALWLFWSMVGDFAENRRSMEEALAVNRPLSATARARVLHTAGVLAWCQGDCSSAERLEEESAGLFRELGDDLGAGIALGTRGMVANQLQQHERTVTCCEHAADCFRRAGLRWGVGTVLSFEAAGWLGLGDRARAKLLAAEGLTLCRETGERYGASICALHVLAGLAQADGEQQEAKRLYAEGLTISAAIGEKPSIVHCLQGMAELAGSEGQAMRAARLWGAAEALLEQLETQGFPSSADRSRQEARISPARAALGDEAFLLASAEGKRLTPEAAVAEALSPLA